MTEIAEIFQAKKKDQIDEHFAEYRRLCERVQLRNVREALQIWVEWQETTARLLMADAKNREWAMWKIADAKQRRSEAEQIAEKAKDRKGRKK